MNATDTVFFFLSIGLAAVFFLGILKYATREKYAASIDQSPEAKQRILGSSTRMIFVLRLFLWMSPLYLIVLPWLLSSYSDQNAFVVFICMALIVANVFVEYLYRKWLYQSLTKPGSA